MTSNNHFWNKEYKKASHLALSEEPAEDLKKFMRWLIRQKNLIIDLHKKTTVVDLGCGNGRNINFLAEEYGCVGYGYDTSSEAVSQAKSKAAGLPLTLEIRSIAESLPQKDETVTIVLDMMSSHFLNKAERERLRDEIFRVLEKGGFLFFKTFLSEGDIHAERLLNQYPGEEAGTYIHPRLQSAEHVWTIDEIRSFFEPKFAIRKIEKSHKHILRGKAFKRRTVSVYLEKI